MFRISPINDKALQKQYAELCGTEPILDFFAYSMIDAESGELMGFSQFEIGEGCGYIATLLPRVGYSDFEAMFILGRATMNFIDMCGVHICRAAKDAGDERLLRAIGFKETEGDELIADMTGMFDGHCGGNEK
ncbi:MAG: hypothetical protein IJ515_06330 [Clostridia bacterium]|nr:hypothetical protein [Clostridia bacterium]